MRFLRLSWNLGWLSKTRVGVSDDVFDLLDARNLSEASWKAIMQNEDLGFLVLSSIVALCFDL